MFYTVLLPKGVLQTVSPAFNCKLAQWVAGLGGARRHRPCGEEPRAQGLLDLLPGWTVCHVRRVHLELHMTVRMGWLPMGGAAKRDDALFFFFLFPQL